MKKSRNQSAHRNDNTEAARLVLGIAKKLHKAATSESLAISLPVLRRILASATLQNISLAELRRRKAMVQRKHILRMLAIEAGFKNWEKYRRALETMTPSQLTHFDLVQREAGYPNLWFSSADQAREHAANTGGLAMQVGQQGVIVFPQANSASSPFNTSLNKENQRVKMQPADFLQMKGVKRIPMLTAYTCPIAKSIAAAGIPVILVGDTVGMVEMGFESTRDVTIEHMEYHVGAVRRGASDVHIIGDLPYLTDTDADTALINAQRLIAAGADSIKLEGPKTDIIAHLVANAIPVVGHTGLTPQTATNFKKVGGTSEDAKRIIDEAKAIQDAGAFMVVLEHIPYALATTITQSLIVPTIGIGAGPDCDGQVLVINDALGLGDYWPPFSKQYAHASQTVLKVARDFLSEVEAMEFPNNIIQLRSEGRS